MQTLKDLMSTEVKTITPEETIQTVARCMHSGDFGMLPVIENDRMIGVITDRDIAVRAVAEGKDCGTRVRDVMSKEMICAHENEMVASAMRLMSEHQVRRLPIVNADKKIVGIVALGDLARVKDDVTVAGETLAQISKPGKENQPHSYIACTQRQRQRRRP